MKTYSIDEVAEILGVHSNTVHVWANTGEIGSVNVSRSRTSRKPVRRITQAALDVFIASRETKARQPSVPRSRMLPKVKDYVGGER